MGATGPRERVLATEGREFSVAAQSIRSTEPCSLYKPPQGGQDGGRFCHHAAVATTN